MIRNLLTAQTAPASVAVLSQDKSVSYARLLEASAAVSAAAVETAQQSIAVFLPDGETFLAALWGVFQVGRTAFPLHTLLPQAAIAALLKQADTQTVITSETYRGLFLDVAAQMQLPLQVIFIETLSHAPLPPAPQTPPEAPMLLLGTSGTTGTPKIVQLSEANVEASVCGYLERAEFHLKNEEVRVLLATPFSSIYGIMILCACLKESVPLVVPDPVFTLSSLFQTAEKHRVTHYEGSASVILLMEQAIGREIPYDLHQLHYFGFGGSKISGNTLDAVLRAYPGIELSQGYGMTEAAPLIAKHGRRKPLQKTDSVGQAIKGSELAVATEAGISHKPFVRGEILVRGANVMLGYLGNDLETAQTLRDGWLHTGDIGYLDEEGFLFICGRKKSMVILRGFKVYPEEIETALLASGLVRDCAVFGKMDCSGNETLCADILPLSPQTTPADLRKYCQTVLAPYQVPQQIQFVEYISKNAGGKTVRTGETHV